MYWANLIHIYQPPNQKKEIINKVVNESYNKILNILKQNSQIKISLNICASLTEQLIEHGHKHIINTIKELSEKGQVELVGSAKYHPILPFLPKSEIKRQIELNEKTNKKYFGKVWEPKGFFLPELAYNKRSAKIIQELGYKWVVLDEIAYNKDFNSVLFNKIYAIKGLHRIDEPFNVVFRNRGLSLLFFSKYLDSIDKFYKAVENDDRSDKFLITAFDGENLGHHIKNLINIWEELLNQKQIKSINYSKYLNLLDNSLLEKVKPINSTWSTELKHIKKNIPYPLWKHKTNPIHKLQWKLTNLIIKIVNNSKKDINFEKARNLLDRALHSDQYWWASNNPWYSESMIKNGINMFVHVADLLSKSVGSYQKTKIKKISKQILDLI